MFIYVIFLLSAQLNKPLPFIFKYMYDLCLDGYAVVIKYVGKS